MNPTSLTGCIEGYLERLDVALKGLSLERIDSFGEILYRAYQHRRQVFIVGNGGSAATASHMACDLGKNTIDANAARFRVMSLTDNTPLLSALANDDGYDAVFAEQLVNLIQPGDVLLAISCSGRSPNVVRAMRYARTRSATTLAFLGCDGGAAAELADECVLVPSHEYEVIEDVHMVLNHVMVCYFRDRLRRDPV